MRRLSLALVVVATAGAAVSARAAEPRATVEGVNDTALHDLIVQAIGEVPAAAPSRFEARRRATAAGDNAIAVLRSEGYYAYTVTPDLNDGDPPRPVVRIETGPRFDIADPHIDWVGAAPALEGVTAANAAIALPNGTPGRAAAVLAAEGRVVARLQEQGYADVRAEPREVIVDHADKTVRPAFRIAAGQIVRLDGLNLANADGRTNPGWLASLTPWKAGDVYKPDLVGELERRLRDTGVYDSVTVALQDSDKATPDGLRPVLVSLSDRARRTVELGAGYSTSEGVGVDGRLIRYNRFHRADTETLTARLAEIERRLDAEVALPHWRRAQQTLKFGGGLYQTNSLAYEETGAGIRADVTRRFGRSSATSLGAPASYLTVGASLDITRTTDTTIANPTGRERDLATLTTLGAFAWDASDSPLDPKRGWRLEARGEPTLTVGDSKLGYFRTSVQGTAYLPMGAEAQTVLAGRVRVGSILGGAVSAIPAARRFYAGGGGSVRGYAYQAIGPRLADNTPQGGASLLETSFEVRHKINQQWGAVAFVDAGAVSPYRTPSAGDFSVGAGFGVRYDLGFGPIRADIAFPLDKRQGDPAFQIYISIGQSF
ncbi:MAG: hypothetical protein BGN86_03160 [Caulobacterales bacterium 68-7]|nr:MAG: hypothetical protein BGN86_03160 [Caulobacterales bacterium 68-7]